MESARLEEKRWHHIEYRERGLRDHGAKGRGIFPSPRIRRLCPHCIVVWTSTWKESQSFIMSKVEGSGQYRFGETCRWSCLNWRRGYGLEWLAHLLGAYCGDDPIE